MTGMRLTKGQKTSILLGIFVACLILANVLGSKIVDINLPGVFASPLNVLFFPLLYPLKHLVLILGGREIPMTFFNTLSVSAGTIVFPILFLTTDIIAEVYGKKKVREFIAIGAVCMLLMILTITIAIYLPASARSINDETFNSVFKVSLRMTIASIIAFVIAQLHDVWAFEFWKRKTSGRFLWFRNNASTIVSQLLDSTIFMFIAFYRTTPMWDAVFVVSLIIPLWMIKILLALLDTPFVYIGVWWLNKKEPYGKTDLELGV